MRIPELQRTLVEAARLQEHHPRSPHSIGLLSPRHWQPWKRLAASGIGALAAIGAATAALVIGLAGPGTATAFAGWSASPTAASSGQLQAAQSACQSVPALPSGSPALASLTPTLADTRGPFSLLVYTQNGASTVCIAGLPQSGTAILSAGEPYVTSVAPGTIEPQGHFADGAFSGQAQYHLLVGETGAGVTGVALTLDDGTSVDATATDGWFAAWWPGTQGVQSAAVTTANGTTTQQLNIPALDMRGGPGNSTPPAAAPTGS
jgi:hypothetical protein